MSHEWWVINLNSGVLLRLKRLSDASSRLVTLRSPADSYLAILTKSNPSQIIYHEDYDSRISTIYSKKSRK